MRDSAGQPIRSCPRLPSDQLFPLSPRTPFTSRSPCLLSLPSPSFPSSPQDEYLGFLGPVLRAQVGDTIKILLKNQLVEQHAVTLHPHGVLYNKSSEGAPYMDGTWDADKADDAVLPGTTHM